MSVIKTGECKFNDELGNLCLAESFDDNGVVSSVITILEQKASNIGLIEDSIINSAIVMYDNFYVKAPIELLNVSIPISDFAKQDCSYMTITEYLSSKGKRITYINSSNTLFIQGFTFNLDGLDELRNKLSEFKLELGLNIWILSPNEAREELSKEEWNETKTSTLQS